MAQYGLFVLKVPLNPNQPTEVVVTTGTIRRAKLKSSSQNVTISQPTPSFYRLDALPVTQPTVSKH